MNWSSDENIKLAYRLLSIKGYGPAQTNRLLWSVCAHVSSNRDFETAIVNSLSVADRIAFSNDFNLYHSTTNKVSYLSILDELYPKDLLNSLSQNSPTVLSYIGNIDLIKKRKIAFSGSRKVSERGLWITRDSVDQLIDDDVCIVSGYANGVDIAAHRQALVRGASTILVLPEGIRYFSIKKELEDVWDWNKVLVLSEFFPNDKWLAGRAMKRNMTLIGLSDSVVVVEAGETGGSLDAGMKTIAMNKGLFVPKYSIAPDSAKGNEILLRHGAQPITYNGQTNRTNISSVKTMMANPIPTTLFY